MIGIDISQGKALEKHLNSIRWLLSGGRGAEEIGEKLRPYLSEWVSYARTYHAYQNRTFAAHKSLMADIDYYPNLMIAYLGYGKLAPHGVYLELKKVYKGKYKILREAVNSNLRVMVRELGLKLLKRLYEFEWQKY